LAAVDPGYRTEDVVAVAIELPPSRYSQSADQQAFFVDLMSRVHNTPGVSAVGAVSYLPMSPIGTEFDMPFTVEGLEVASPSQRPTAEYRGVFPGYFEAMDIELVDGRMLDDIDGMDDNRVALINETVVQRYFSDRDPIGQMLVMPMLGDVEIVGVVEDIRHDGLGVEANAEMYVPFMHLPLSAMHVVAYAPGNPGNVVGAIRQHIVEIDPALPITRVNLISDLVSSSIAPSRFNMALLMGLAVTALLLSLVGVYGVVSYTVARRTQELGVRIALGADANSTIRLVLGQAGRLVALGAMAGIAVALASSRLLEGLLYGVEALDVQTFIAVPIGLVAIAMIAAGIPAMRVARIDPAIALRKD
jgi:putative ABC transport system permease protein